MVGRVDRALGNWHMRKRDPAADAARRQDPSAQAGTDLLPQIQHIVVLMMENHSFDNYLGNLTSGEENPSVSNARADGTRVNAHHLPGTAQEHGVPTQSWHASHIQYAGGTNSGFVASVEQTVPGGDATVPMGYWTASDLPFYAGLAKTFPVADSWFCSCLGPTFPNRRFLLAATANGLIDDVPTGMVDYPKTGTIFDLLARHGISWANYHHVPTWRMLLKRIGLRGWRTLGLALGNLFPNILKATQGNIQFTADLYPLGIWRSLGHLRTIEQFYSDAAAGTLPAVSVVDPDFQMCSEENPQDIQSGEGFAASIIDAVMRGKAWEHTLLIWFYDEHGGYYDHVAPPEAAEPDDVLPHSLLSSGGPIRWLLKHFNYWTPLQQIDTMGDGSGRYDRYGFRVPAVVVSPYSRPGYVSSTVYDHTSVLKLIEEKWNLPPLTRRDAAATSPLDMVDFDSPPVFLTPPVLPDPAKPWPSASPAMPARIKVAQRLGLVGRTVPAHASMAESESNPEASEPT